MTGAVIGVGRIRKNNYGMNGRTRSGRSSARKTQQGDDCEWDGGGQTMLLLSGTSRSEAQTGVTREGKATMRDT